MCVPVVKLQNELAAIEETLIRFPAVFAAASKKHLTPAGARFMSRTAISGWGRMYSPRVAA
ncbi:MAG: hypothetical protein H0V39_07735 [Nitrosomonas sp.]|nr:hypothetical protein [Nitrosomonas sp.]